MAATAASMLNRMRPHGVLIVDVQAAVRRRVRAALQNGPNGFYALYEAADGATALRLARTVHPHLVVLGQLAQDAGDALRFCRQLRADAGLAHVPVLVLAPPADEADRQAALAAGASHFLTQPFAPAALRGLVECLLETTRPTLLQ